MPNSFQRDLAMLIVLAAMWSSSFAVIKIGAVELPAATFAMLRIGTGAIVLFAWMKARGMSLPRAPRLWVSFFLIGAFGNAIPFVMINWGEQQIASGLAAILVASMPLAALVLGRIFSDEILSTRRTVGVLVGFAGVVILIGPQELLHLGDQVLRQLAVAGAAVCYAIAGILVRKLPTPNPTQQGAGVLVASIILLAPVALVADRSWTLDFSSQALAAAVYLGVFPTALATILLMKVIHSRGVTFLALNNYLIPLLGVTWGFLFLDEAVTTDILIALAMIFAGIAVAGGGPATRRELAPKAEKAVDETQP